MEDIRKLVTPSNEQKLQDSCKLFWQTFLIVSFFVVELDALVEAVDATVTVVVDEGLLGLPRLLPLVDGVGEALVVVPVTTILEVEGD